MKYVPPDGFFGIQILPSSISVGARPRTPGELTTLLQASGLGRGIHPPDTTPARRIRRLAVDAFGTEKWTLEMTAS